MVILEISILKREVGLLGKAECLLRTESMYLNCLIFSSNI